ncbi:MAG: ABC-2 family transporter protein [Clostridia bacterium]|nr:ABC-2 family transporter protein [Clostridia bacterium]
MRLYLKFVSMHLKRSMAYRQSFFLSTLGQFLISFSAFLSMWFLLSRFGTVGGYTLGECMLCAGVTLSGFSLAECFFRGFDRFSGLVRSAGFDRVMLRPRGLMLQVLCDDIEFARLGKLIQSIVMLAWGVARSPVAWTPWRALVLLLMVAGGTVIFAALFILYAALCFFTLEGLEVVNIFTHGMREYGVYPLDVYGGGILKFCTFVIPYALFQYYPLMALLGRTEHRLLGLMPLLTPLFLLPCAALWQIGVRRYKSAGS